MICNRCGYNNREGSQFCIKCGQRIIFMTAGGTSLGNTLNDGSMLQNRYGIVKQLGKGGMGVVYLAKDNRFSNRICVVKEMMEFLLAESEKEKAITRFNQEADLLAAINHPNVPQVYDRFSQNNRHYLVMEFVEGMDLKNLLHEHMSLYSSPVPEEDVIIFLMQLCSTLKYLHSHKPVILHRDIKPSNILLNCEGRAKLVDFGIAKAIQTNTQGTSIGTQGYAAPEQYKGLADARTDIYALGATIHHLLTGRDPQLEAPFDYPPVRELNDSVSQDVSDMVAWMLQMSIDSRPQRVEDIMDRVRSICPDIDQKMINYSAQSNGVNKIVSRKSASEEIEPSPMNVCGYCGCENNLNCRFCIRCGKRLGSGSQLDVNGTGQEGISGQFDMVIPQGRSLAANPDSFRECIKIPAKDGSIRLNIVLERYYMDNAEYIYITEKLPSIMGKKVLAYNVVRNSQGAMQYIRPVSNPATRAKICARWQQILYER